MHQRLIKYINNRATVPLTSEEEAQIMAAFQPKKLRKRQYFLQEGEVCKNTCFIVKGAMRQYRVDADGMEHIVHLYIEDYWATDRESSTMLSPSVYNIDAWEDCELLVISRADILDLMGKIPALVEMIRSMDERYAIANNRRLSSTIGQTAEKRYEEFARIIPSLFSGFPNTL
jgi:CRP-like cAMP-binding protein